MFIYNLWGIMAKNNSANPLKSVLVILLILAIFGLGIPFVGGMFSAINPKESIQMAQQKTMENQQPYLPEGYNFTKIAEKQDLGTEVIYVTQMTSDTAVINLIKMESAPACKTEVITVGSISVCSSKTVNRSNQPVTHYVWVGSNGAYQLDFVAGTVSEVELGKLLQSV